MEEASTNVELKAADASNPYLALGGMIAAGSTVSTAGSSCGAGGRGPGDHERREREERGIVRLPRTQAEALEALEADAVLAGALGETLIRSYLTVGAPVGGVFGGGRGIRAPGSLSEVLGAVGLVDHHAHAVLRRHPGRCSIFAACSPRATDPKQWPHVTSSVSYRHAIAELAAELGCEADEEAVFDVRLPPAGELRGVSSARDGHRRALLDDGFPAPGDGFGWQVMGELAAMPRVAGACASSRTRGPRSTLSRRALTGLLRSRRSPPTGADCAWTAAIRCGACSMPTRQTGDPLPVQVRGFGTATCCFRSPIRAG